MKGRDHRAAAMQDTLKPRELTIWNIVKPVNLT